jgi:hypothetical protein
LGKATCHHHIATVQVSNNTFALILTQNLYIIYVDEEESADEVSSISSFTRKNFMESRSPITQPSRPSTTVIPSQMSSTAFKAMLKTEANTPARMMPTMRPAVMPIRQPGCARLRPSNCFFIAQKVYLYPAFCLHTDDSALERERQVGS